MLNRGAAAVGRPIGRSSWTTARRVIGALLLRELLTRYGRNNIGFLWLFVEPMLFVAIVSLVWVATRRIHGSSIPIVAFSLTGYTSLLLWRGMPSRCIGALKSNRSLLYHRQVTIMDVYFARVLLECMAVTTSLVALGIIFCTLEFVPPPEDYMKVLDKLTPANRPREELIEFVADRPGHDARYAIDAARLETELGWRAQENFDTGIEKTVQWYLDNDWWWRPLRERYAGQRLGLLKSVKG
jgi:hypothetical protein